MRSRISIIGCVRPSVPLSVRPSVHWSHTSWNPAKVPFSTKITGSTSVNASYAVYTALFVCSSPFTPFLSILSSSLSLRFFRSLPFLFICHMLGKCHKKVKSVRTNSFLIGSQKFLRFKICPFSCFFFFLYLIHENYCSLRFSPFLLKCCVSLRFLTAKWMQFELLWGIQWDIFVEDNPF